MSKKEEIALALHEIGAIKFGEFTLKSGIKSPIYIDLRLLISYPKVLRLISEAMIEMAKGLKFDVIAGIPYTALPIATAISISQEWPMVYARKEVKDYGTKKKIEGVFKEGDTALVIDDLITTGGSKFETVEPFEASGLKITDFLVLVDREQGGGRQLEEKGYKLHSIIGINELLDILKRNNKIDAERYQEVKEFIAATQV
ncbi:orotate phosphoribosyltransferase [Patescibacteria group bacterium]|nr:orotate phosphoribosyltransferase [Patescibacteria group bacterium]MBU1016192.1 orotate phosphoribosyltransferase [Patescibacteria group bacterium]MBU1684691.1 orotate phosphoribosyltransferase [Patescibacteria group bacterium]MBU1938942.1 orotate phosphoribosyltransferase [Patescibacteria group bacterium]